jgi:hypothetical protein
MPVFGTWETGYGRTLGPICHFPRILRLSGSTLGGHLGEESGSMVRVPKLTLLRRKQELHPAKHWLDGLPDHDLETI